MSAVTQRRSERWMSLALALALLVAGVAGSWAGARAWQSSVKVENRAAYARTAAIISGSVRSALQRDLDFAAVTRAVVDIEPDTSNASLTRWYSELNAGGQYPGAVALAYIEKVADRQLDTYRQEALADPVKGTSVPFTLIPGGVRPSYCFVRLEVLELRGNPISKVLIFPPGLDLCSLMGAPISRAESTDSVQVIPGQQFIDAIRGYFGQFPDVLRRQLLAADATVINLVQHAAFAVAPVYRVDTNPTTPTERSADLVGWTLAAYQFDTVTDQAVAGQPGWAATLSLAQGHGVQRFAHSGPSKTAGPSTTLAVGTGRLPWQLTVAEQSAPSTTSQFLLVLLGGVLVTILLSALIVVLGTSRRRALDLVDQRTGELRHLALHDALTNLPNRVLILDRATQMLARAERNHSVTTALFVDLDNFKDINDTLGHAAGDEFLRAVAERLKSALRKGDTIGRLGGDEFVVLAEDHAPSNPELIANRIFAALDEPFRLGSSTRYRIAASIGIATASSGSAADLLRDADIALYEAKASGKNRHVVFRSSMHQVVESRFELDMALRKAVDHDEFFIVYQPVFSVADPVTIGVEALVRWRHPTRGVVPPDQFIPVLEENGLIVPVGRWVAKEACLQAARWHSEGFALTVAVNVSPRQLEDPNFVGDIAHALHVSGIDPGDLTLEITEGALIRDPDQTVAVLKQIKQLGVRLAIDDFGTGYSSMSYLQRLPVDILKIDRSFISGMGSPETAALVRTFVQLGETLGLETVAEGIEERSQLVSLQHEGCSAGQGYLFSRPLEVRDMTEFLAAHPQVSAGV